MNVQIFGKPKCFDTKKTQRYFKERNIKFQFVDVTRYGLSQAEYESVKKAVGGMDQLIDDTSRAYEKLHIAYLAPVEAIEERLLEYPEMFKTPIVRNGKLATVGYHPEIWKLWE